MRRIVWSPRGLRLFESEVLDYVANRNEAAARRLRADMDRAIRLLAQRPIGRPGRISGTYEKTLTGQPCIIAYSFSRRDDGAEDDLVILRVVHTARDWPPGRWPR